MQLVYCLTLSSVHMDALVSNKPRIFTSRFTNETLLQNREYKKRLGGWKGSLYGTPRRVKASLPLNRYMFVLEMNNDTNTTIGIGLVRNMIYCEKVHRIYNEGNYNRFIYKSKYRIDKEEMSRSEKALLEVFDVLLFKGRRHCKLSQGITEIGQWIKDGPFDFVEYFKKIFNRRYTIEW